MVDISKTSKPEDFERWIGVEKHLNDTFTSRMLNSWKSSLDFDGLEIEGMPLGMHWGMAPDMPTNAELALDGHAKKGGFLPPISLPRRMWAGGELKLFDTFQLGDVIERHSVIKSIDQKTGRSGELWFVAVQHQWSTQRGVAITERQDIVYRGETGKSSASNSQTGIGSAENRAQNSLEIACSATTLFRFSALTFNSHRIHYDFPYATDVEGYSGLVIHGPLQAALLLNYARQMRKGVQPNLFRFRGVSPLILGQPFFLNAEENDDGLSLWVCDAAGQVTMKAQAGWNTDD